MPRPNALVILALASLHLWFAGAGRAEAESAVDGPVVRALFAAAPTVLDPHLTVSVVNGWYLDNAFEPLFRLDADGSPAPMLATATTPDEEGGYLVHLREGVRFHDGRLLTAGDVVASLRRAASRPGAPGALAAVTASETPDPAIVRLRTELPRPLWQAALSLVEIVPAGSPEEITQPNGTGPFRLEAVDTGRFYRLTRFAEHWGGLPAVARVEILVEPDGGRRVERLLAGDADFIAGVTGSRLAAIDESRRYWVATSVGTAIAFMAFDACRKPFDDPRLREAVDLAIDRARIAARLDHLVRPTAQLLTPASPGYDSTLAPAAPDLAASRRLLAERGLGDGLDLTLLHSPGTASIAQELVAQLAAVGVRVQLEQVAVDRLLPAAAARSGSVVLTYLFGAPGDPTSQLSALLGSPGSAPGFGSRSYARCGSPEMDAALARVNAVEEPAARRQALVEVSRLVLAQRTLLPLAWGVDLFGLRNDLEWIPRADGRVLFAELRFTGVGRP